MRITGPWAETKSWDCRTHTRGNAHICYADISIRWVGGWSACMRGAHIYLHKQNNTSRTEMVRKMVVGMG